MRRKTIQPTGEFELARNEKLALDYRASKLSFAQIAKKLFKGKMTRQAVQQLVQTAKRKKWRIEAKERYAGRLLECPVNETPLATRLRASLLRAKITKLGQLIDVASGKVKVSDIGKDGVFAIEKLIAAWGIKKPGVYCPNCGAPLDQKPKSANGNEVQTLKSTCSSCGVEFKGTLEHAAA